MKNYDGIEFLDLSTLEGQAELAHLKAYWPRPTPEQLRELGDVLDEVSRVAAVLSQARQARRREIREGGDGIS